MKLLLICLSVIYITTPITCVSRAIDTFEFGLNEGRIVFSTSGSMGYWEKIKRVPIIVPECMWLKHVRVNVNSHFGPPEVKLDWSTNIVTIEFSPLQDSMSQFTVVAKAAMKRYCRSSLAPEEPLFDIPEFLI